MVLAYGILPLCHVVLPLVGGISLWRLGGLVDAKCLVWIGAVPSMPVPTPRQNLIIFKYLCTYSLHIYIFSMNPFDI